MKGLNLNWRSKWTSFLEFLLLKECIDLLLVQNEKEDVYIPSPPSSVNLGDASFSFNDEMTENDTLNNNQSNMEWKDVWDDNSSNASPKSNECDITRKGSKKVFNNSDASESSKKNCKTEFSAFSIGM